MANSSPALVLVLALALPGSALSGNVPTIAGSEGGGGGFQQGYTHQYAEEFEQFMSSGDEGKQGNLPQFASGILGEHASLFEKYMDTPGFKAGQRDGQQSLSGDSVNFVGQAGAADATAPSTEASSMQGGGYQQYARDYQKFQSGGYQQYMGMGQKYMHQGGAQQSQSGGYQQYMEQYSPDSGGYKQYVSFMGQPGAANATPSTEASSMQGGGWQKYMHGAQQPQSGGYQQYMDKYSPDYGGYKQYMNFMGQPGAANATPSTEASSMQGGGWQKYMHQGGAEQSTFGGYQQFMDMGQKYMHQSGAQQSQPAGYLTNASDFKEWAAYYTGMYQKYMKENSSNYSVAFAQQFAGSNMTQDDARQRWSKTYMDKYAAPYQHYYTHREAATPSVPASASSCHNVSELKAWRTAKIEQIKSYVPMAYRASAEDGVERTFQSNRARIEREQADQAQRLEDKEGGKAVQDGSAAPAEKKADKAVQDKADKAVQEGTAEAAGDKTVKAAQEGSAAPADGEAGNVDQEAPAEPAADKAGKAARQEASMETASAAGSADQKTGQGSADRAIVEPPAVAANASAVQLVSEGSMELVRKTHMDGSAASIAACAGLALLLVVYVGKDRRRQRVMEAEVYTNLIAEP